MRRIKRECILLPCSTQDTVFYTFPIHMGTCAKMIEHCHISISKDVMDTSNIYLSCCSLWILNTLPVFLDCIEIHGSNPNYPYCPYCLDDFVNYYDCTHSSPSLCQKCRPQFMIMRDELVQKIWLIGHLSIPDITRAIGCQLIVAS